MEHKLQPSHYLGLLDNRLKDNASQLAAAPTDLIFVQDFGLLPRRIVSASRPAPLPVQERKWLGADFSHVIVGE